MEMDPALFSDYYYFKEVTMTNGICWFCKKNLSDALVNLPVRLKIELSKYLSMTQDLAMKQKTMLIMDTSKEKVINVPRCKSCASIHKKEKKIENILIYFIMTTIIPITMSFGYLGFHYLHIENVTVLIIGIIIFWLIFCSAISTFWSMKISEGIISEDKKNEYPEVREHLRGIWYEVK
jgi:hypothetical protein